MGEDSVRFGSGYRLIVMGIVMLLGLVSMARAEAPVDAASEAFEGQLVNVRGTGRTQKGVIETGGQISCRGADGTWLFAQHLGAEAQSYLVLLWRPPAGSSMEWTSLKDTTIVETWLWSDPLTARVLASPQQFNGQRDFLNVTPAQRKRVAGAYLLKGKVHIRRFVMNTDFQIDLDVATDTDPPRKIKGTLYAGGSKPEGAVAAEPVPKKGPAAPAGVDLSTPVKAVRAYAEALRDGDEAKLRSVHHTAGKDWDAAIDAFVRWAKSSVRLERAAVAKFGRGGADRVLGQLLLPPAGQRGRDLLENIGDAEVQVRGDRATVEVEPVGRIDLRRIDGQWGIFMTGGDTGVGARGQPKASHLSVLRLLATVQDRLAADIEAGRLLTADAAVTAAGRAASAEAKALGIDMGGEDEEDRAK